MVGSKEWKWSPSVLSIMFNQMFYPLVNIQKTMESHHFWWENPLFLWPFSIAKCYSHYQVSWLIRWYPWWFSIHCPSVLQPDRYIQYIYSPCDVQSQAYGYYIYNYIYMHNTWIWYIQVYVYIYITLVAHDIKWYHTNPCFKGIDDWAMLKLSGSAELRGFGAGESSVFPWKILI